MKAILAAVCGVLLLGAVPKAKIDADMKAAVARHQVAGMTLAVVENGQVVYEHAYGMRNVDADEPATLTTDYEIGSMTKQFTAAAVMQLVDAGKIALDAKLATYLPKAPHASEVTIRELLSHTSGEPDYLKGSDVVEAAGHPGSFDQLMARIAGKPLLFTPGTQWSYSNTNYILLGRVIEVASGQPYDQYLFDRVLGPVKGENFTTMADEDKLPQMSRGYMGADPAPPLDNSWAWSAGNLVGTVSDMIAWDAALSAGDVVPLADYGMMTSVQTPPGAKTTYGFGFVVDRFEGQPRIWHNGGTFGFNTTDQWYPQQQTRVIVLTNNASGGADALADRVFNDLYPAIAAAADRAAPGEDPAFTARVKKVFAGFLAGKIDRTQFDAQANAALTDALVAHAAKQFAALGTPKSYTFRGCTMQGSLKVCKYGVEFPAATMVLTVGTDPDGKINMIFLGNQ